MSRKTQKRLLCHNFENYCVRFLHLGSLALFTLPRLHFFYGHYAKITINFFPPMRKRDVSSVHPALCIIFFRQRTFLHFETRQNYRSPFGPKASVLGSIIVMRLYAKNINIMRVFSPFLHKFAFLR